MWILQTKEKEISPNELDLLIFIFTLDLKKETSEIYSNYEQINLL